MTGFLLGYLGCAALLCALLLAFSTGGLAGWRGRLTVRHADGRELLPWQGALLIAGALLFWPLTLVLILAQNRGSDDDPPGPPAMGGA